MKPQRIIYTVLAYVALAASILLIPHYTSTGYDWSESGDVVLAVIGVSLKPYRFLAPIFHIATLLLILAILYYGNQCRRIFAVYFAFNYALIAWTQGIAVTDQFGFAIVTGTVISIGLISLLWFVEAIKPQQETVFKKVQFWRYWVVPFAFLAFWTPKQDLKPIYLLTSDYGIAFCFTTPVVLALLSLFYPNVNKTLFRVTAVVGLVIGILNMYSWFNPASPHIWLGILHFPLLFVSAYALVLTMLPERFLMVDKTTLRTKQRANC